MHAPAKRAAQYLRMSREHQRYSLAYQSAHIADFAREHGFEVCRTYVDAGLSGLRLKGREGLKQLLADIVSEDPGFGTVLVYDVSRWGRFQDPDESAHYEFLCRQAGITVVYCAEPFAADTSLTSVLVKHLKRAMAAEYSRELSVKVAKAQRGLARLGYWRGGSSGYGFRRRIAGPDGAAGFVMERRQRKALVGTRTVLVAGPVEERAVVSRIFELFGDHAWSTRDIARELNAQGVPRGDALPWSPSYVRRMLRDEKYIGTLVAGRRVCQLDRITIVPSEGWARMPNACPQLVSTPVFERVQATFRRRRAVISEEQLLDELRRILEANGRLSEKLIRKDRDSHCVSVFVQRFGGLSNAYRRVGYVPTEAQRRAAERMVLNNPQLARRRGDAFTDQELIAHLAAVASQHGRLSCELIDGTPDGPTSSTYRRRFGSMQGAYDRVGYKPTPRQRLAMGANDRLKNHGRGPTVSLW